MSMGVYIKGMEMPLEKSRIIQIYPDGTVRRLDGSVFNSHFEAVPVPPHGDLIDRNELKENCMKEDSFLAELLFRKVSNAPTIIPAEEGE
jgi:hypothetical protein